MGSKKQTDEELLAQFDDLTPESKAKPTTSGPSSTSKAPKDDKDDPLAELATLAQERPKSRPHTPQVGGKPASQSSPKKSSEDSKARKSTESGRSFHQSQAPGVNEGEETKESEADGSAAADAGAAGGGWFGGWGGIVATAQSAVKQAEAIAKEIQKNEEAQRWAEQVRGNVSQLRTYGGELQKRALPTFTNILHTLAPPISSHERLQIHTTHDFIGYPSLDPLIYQTFSRVMSQVEGGELMILQRGSESSPRRGSEAGYTGSGLSGWNDGPWWKQAAEKRDLGAVKGLVEGTKLVKVSAEQYASDHFAAKGGVEEAAKQATEVLSETNPTRSSDIFLAIQAISHEGDQALFGGPPSNTQDDSSNKAGVVDPAEGPEELIAFAIYLHDPIHSITFHALTQSLPAKWVAWLDNLAAAPEGSEAGTPEDIRQIIEGGGVDPREWVSEWVEEVLATGVGVVAQRYVARRMGVGEGGIKGKAREANIDAGAGEAARAM